MNLLAPFTKIRQWAKAFAEERPFDRGDTGPFGSLITILGGNPGDNPVFLKRAEISATAARAMWCLSSDIAQVPLLIEKRMGKGKWERLEDDAPDFGGIAGVFEKVNRTEGKTAFWIKVYSSRAAFGKSPILLDYLNFGRPVARGSRVPQELQALRGDWVTPEFERGRSAPARYRYSPTGMAPQTLLPEQIVYSMRPSIAAPWATLSMIAPAQVYALIEDALGWYHHGFFRNGARAGVILETPEKLTEKDVKRFKREFDEQHGNAAGKSFGTWLFHHGMTYKEPGSGRKDSDFPELFRITKEQVGMSFGVYPARLGDFSNAALANIEEQTPMYYEGTLIPESKILCEDLTEIAAGAWDADGKIRFRYDWDSTPAMRRLALKRVTAYVAATGVPYLKPDEVRELEGREPLENGVGSKLYLPFSVSPAGEDPPPPQAPVVPEAGKAYSRKWIDSPERNTKRAHAKNSMDRFIKSADRELRAALTAQEKRVLAAVEDDFAKSGPLTRVKKSGDDAFDDEFEAQVMGEVVARIRLRVAQVRGPEAAQEVGSNFLIDDPEVVRFLRDNAYATGKLITDTTSTRIADLIADSVADGDTLEDLTTKIRDAYGRRRDEAQRIAITEVSRSYNASTLAAWGQSGAVEATEWLTAHDDHVRDSHREIDGKTALLGEKFANGCEYPGDPDADADETINCLTNPLAPIRTSRGPLAVRDVKVGTLVLTHAGRYRRVVRVRSKDLYSGTEVTLRTVHGQVRVTAGHPLLTPSGWNRADALKTGDFVGILCPATDVEGTELRGDGLSKLADGSLGGFVSDVRFADRRKEGDEFRPALLDSEVGQENVGAQAARSCGCLESVDGHPVGSRVRRLGLVDDAEAERALDPMQDRKVAVREEAAHNPARGARSLSDGEATVGVEEPGDVGEVVLGGSHKPMMVSWARIVNVAHEKIVNARVYNFAVEEDESYIAAGFVSHNCRCTTLPVLKTTAERSGFVASPGLSFLFEKTA